MAEEETTPTTASAIAAGKKRLSKTVLTSSYIDDILNAKLLKLGLPYKKQRRHVR